MQPAQTKAQSNKLSLKCEINYEKYYRNAKKYIKNTKNTKNIKNIKNTKNIENIGQG